MSANKYLSYVYLIGWSKLDLWYYGVRYAQVKRRQDYDLWIDYFTHSGPVKHMRAFIGEPDIIHYDKIFDSKKEAIEYENKVLQEHNCKNSNHWLNKHDSLAPPINPMIGKNNPMYGVPSPNRKKTKIENKSFDLIKDACVYFDVVPSTIYRWKKYGKPTREETSEKISKANKGKMLGKNNHMYGKKRTKEEKDQISKSLKGKPAIHKRKRIEINNIIYESVTIASNKLNVCRGTIYNWIKNGKAKYV